jgi:hypothetical protein
MAAWLEALGVIALIVILGVPILVVLVKTVYMVWLDVVIDPLFGLIWTFKDWRAKRG